MAGSADDVGSWGVKRTHSRHREIDAGVWRRRAVAYQNVQCPPLDVSFETKVDLGRWQAATQAQFSAGSSIKIILISFAGTPISDRLATSVLSRSRFASIDRPENIVISIRV
jgi:hypothetical protein